MNDTERQSAKKRAKPEGSGGSRKGVPNKSTANAREAIARFVDGNADRLQGWLDEIAADEKQGPRAAMACFMELVEFHVPKLSRVEHGGTPDGQPIQTHLTVEYVKPNTTA